MVALDSVEGDVDAGSWRSARDLTAGRRLTRGRADAFLRAVAARPVRFAVARFAVARFGVARFAVLRVRLRAVVPRTVVFRAPDRFRVCFRAAFFATMSLRRLASTYHA